MTWAAWVAWTWVAWTWAAWGGRPGCGWLAGAPTVTGSGWTSCTCRSARSCRTGRPGSSSISRCKAMSSSAQRRMLAWLTRGLGVLMPDDAAAARVGGPALRAAGDVTARYRRWCAELAEAAAALDDGSPLGAAGPEPPRGPLDDTRTPSAGLPPMLPRPLGRAELAAAPLSIPSRLPHPAEVPARAASTADPQRP